MSDEKKVVVSEEVKEKAREISMEDLEKISGGDIGQYNNNTALPPKPGEVTNDPKEFLKPFIRREK